MSLESIKNRIWFYEFDLPDGSRTKSDLPDAVKQIHESRRVRLREIIEEKVAPHERTTAFDFASHEGYFSIELAKYFGSVTGFELRDESREAAEDITRFLGLSNIDFKKTDLQAPSAFSVPEPADFVLMYGLLYHLENPIITLRLASQFSKKHILIETQVSTFDVSGKIEDGHFQWQRDIQGTFVIAADYLSGREGGSTNIALIPSLRALVFLLQSVGFTHTEVLEPLPNDYEQFARGSRVIVYGCKNGE